MLELNKAGLSVSDTMAAARGTLQLAAAAQTDNATAAILISSALNTFGLSGEKATIIADQFAAAANAASGDAVDFGQGLAQAGFAFSSLTSDAYPALQAATDLTTGLTALQKAGLSGSDGATALKNAIIKIQAPTAAGAAELSRLGIATTNAQGQFLPFQQILANLERGLAGLTPAQRAAALNTVFLSDGMKAIIPLLQLGTSGFASLQSEITKEGAAAAAAEAYNKGLLGALDGLQSAFQTAGLAAADPFLGPLEAIIRKLAEVVSSFATVDPGIRSAIVAFLAVAAAVGPLSLILGTITSALVAVNVPLALLAGAGAAVGTAFVSVASQLGLLGPVLEQLQRLASLAEEALVGIASAAVGWGSGLIEAYADGMAAAVASVVAVLSQIGDAIAYWLTPGSPPPLLPNLDVWGKGAAEAWLEGWTEADLGALNTLGDQVSGLIRSFGTALGASDQTIVEAMVGSQSAVEAAIDELRRTGEVSEAAFAGIRDAAGPAGAAAEQVARAYLSTLQASQRLRQAQEGQKAASAAVGKAQVDMAKALASGNPQLIAERRAALASAVAKQREARQRVDAAKVAEDAAKEQYARQQALIDAQKRQNDLLAEQIRLQEQASRASGGGGGGGGGGPKKAKKTEEELAAERAAKAEEAYKDSIASTDELLQRRRDELAGLDEGSAEYYDTLREIRQLEERQSREQQQEADKARRDQESITRAERAYKDQVSTTAEKLADRRAELAGLTEGSAEYYDKLREIAQLEEQQKREAEAARKAAERAAKKGAGGRAGGGGGGGIKVPDIDAGGALGGISEVAKKANDLAGQVGGAMQKVAGAFQKPIALLGRLRGETTNAMQKMTTAIEKPERGFKRLQRTVEQVPQTVGQMVGGVVLRLLTAVPTIIDAAAAWSLGILSGLTSRLPGMFAAVTDVATGVASAIGAALPGIIAAAGRWGLGLAGWVVTTIPVLLAGLGTLIASVITVLGAALPRIITEAGGWVLAIATRVVSGIPAILAGIGGAVGAILDAIGGATPGIVAAAAQWAEAFVSWAAPALPFLLGTLGVLAARFLSWIVARVPLIVAQVRQWALAFGSGLVTAGPQLQTTLGSIGGIIASTLRTLAGIIMTAVAPYAPAFLSWLATALPELITRMGEARNQLVAQIGAALPGIIAQVGQWALAFLGWVTSMAPALLAAVGGVTAGLIGVLGGALPGIIAAVGQWALAFLSWLVEAAPGLLLALGTMIGQMLDAVGAALPGIVESVARWAAAFVQWAIEAAPPLFAALLVLIGRLLSWIIERVPGIAGQLAQWALAFLAWVGPAAADLIVALGLMFGQLLGWLIEKVPEIVEAIAEWSNAFVDWVADTAIPALLIALGVMIGDVLSFIGEQVGSIVTKAAEIGTAIVDGVRNGIANGWEGLKSFVREKAAELLAAARGALGMRSPSRRFRDEFGEEIPAGAEVGIDKGTPRAVGAVERMAERLAGVKVKLPSLDTSTLQNAAAVLSGARAALPVVAAGAVADRVGAITAPVAPAPTSSATTIENVNIALPGTTISNQLDVRRVARDLANEFKYQVEKTRNRS